MALRLRRGTDAERLTITPLAGEPIFTTDTKSLYIGDGTTVGGIVVDTSSGGGGAVSLSDLTDVDITTVPPSFSNNVLKWDGFANFIAGNLSLADIDEIFLTATPVSGDILRFDGVHFTPQSATDIFKEQQNYKINIVGDDSTIMVNTDTVAITASSITASTGFFGNVTGNVTGNVDGDLTGSVFGDDNTILLDGINKTYSGNIIGSTEMSSTTEAEVQLSITSLENTSRINLKRQSSTDLSGNTTIQYGTISFGRDDATGLLTTGVIFCRENEIRIGQSSTGAFGTEAVYITWKSNKLGLGRTNPTEQLDMTGNAKIDGFVQFGSLTTTQRDALTAANGMVIYNSSDNKFQGYENGSWVNLV